MADTQTQDAAPQSPAIADLAGSDDKSMSGLVSSLTGNMREKVATDTRLSAESDETQRRDKLVRNQAFAAEGVAASEIPKPWDADKEHKRWESNPIEGFGSAGGLFAMVASAFTKAPMENAINGMAGAINSIKEGNEAGYARAYDAFKTNVKLAEQRFKTQHELYSDALSLGAADAAASAAKFHNAATRFGDTQMLMLAEHGMVKEIYELQASRASAMEQTVKAADALDLHVIRKGAVNAIKKNPPKTDDPTADKITLAAMVQNVYDGGHKYGSAEQEAVGAFMQKALRERKNDQEIADGLAKIHEKFLMKAPNIEGYRQAVQQEEEANNGQPLSPERNAQLQQMFGLTTRPGAAGHGGTALTNDRQIQQDAEAHKAKMAHDHPEWGPEQLDQDRDRYVKDRKIATTAPSGNKLDELTGKIDRLDNMNHTIDKVEELLKKHNAITGLGGKITRPAEAVGNILGSNSTDRKEFERYVAELQEWAPNALNDRNG